MTSFVSDTHFWVGQGPDLASGSPIPDESGSLEPLGRYRNKTLLLTIPDDLDLGVSNLDFISIYSKGIQRSLALVQIPELNVPPSLEQLGMESKV